MRAYLCCLGIIHFVNFSFNETLHAFYHKNVLYKDVEAKNLSKIQKFPKNVLRLKIKIIRIFCVINNGDVAYARLSHQNNFKHCLSQDLAYREWIKIFRRAHVDFVLKFHNIMAMSPSPYTSNVLRMFEAYLCKK